MFYTGQHVHTDCYFYIIRLVFQTHLSDISALLLEHSFGRSYDVEDLDANYLRPKVSYEVIFTVHNSNIHTTNNNLNILNVQLQFKNNHTAYQ